MTRWLPFPGLALLLLGTWLLLQQTLAVAQVLLGAAIAFVAVHAYARLEPRYGPVRRAHLAVRLAGRVLADIVRSNIAVAWIVLSPGPSGARAGFLEIPLELRDTRGLAVLAGIITATPGTSWVRYDSVRGVVTLHILDLIDESAWIRIIKGRYEQPLREIFE